MDKELVNVWADDKKRYTATIPHHRAVQQNTARFLTPIATLIGQLSLLPVFDTNSWRYIVPWLLSGTAEYSLVFDPDPRR